MWLEKLRLQNFRNWQEKDFSFHQGWNLILGPNGSGKSNLLEAIYLLAQGRSPRQIRNSSLLRYQTSVAYLNAWFKNNQGAQQQLSLELRRGGKKYTWNQKTITLPALARHWGALIFLPRHLFLLHGPPQLRREFFDETMSIYSPLYRQKLSAYNHVLRQRNAWLKKGGREKEGQFWNEKLIELGAFLICQRQFLRQKLNQILASWNLKLEYCPSPRFLSQIFPPEGNWHLDEVASHLREKLHLLQEKEKLLQQTLIGPQRDDFVLWGPLGKEKELKNLTLFASRGQQRLAIIRLKLAQLNWLRAELSFAPLLLLDDLFSELDPAHQQALVNSFPRQQLIMTAVQLPPHLSPSAVNIIKL